MPSQIMEPDWNDPRTKLYSDAYDDAVKGGKCPDTSWLDKESKAAVELGYTNGARNQKVASEANRFDPSGEYLTRRYVQQNKWKFAV